MTTINVTYDLTTKCHVLNLEIPESEDVSVLSYLTDFALGVLEEVTFLSSGKNQPSNPPVLIVGNHKKKIQLGFPIVVQDHHILRVVRKITIEASNFGPVNHQ